ncbi:hypothetical protein AN9136.2 [Aspergillus nidulans FGSC A4]|nr:hypothetical protein AN9136.2 [Aspergillus nidulans FGSC A4]|eukprot:XP_682405.1 hypothetical protein AN9136.2 [Aspergillus nidulans FGSC A4]
MAQSVLTPSSRIHVMSSSELKFQTMQTRQTDTCSQRIETKQPSTRDGRNP